MRLRHLLTFFRQRDDRRPTTDQSKQFGRRSSFLCLLLAFCSLLPTATVQAQQSPIVFTVAVGYENAFHIDEWFPVRVVVENSGPDVRGQLVFRVQSSRSQPSAYEIDLPRGARKQVTLYAVANDSSRLGEIAFEVDGREIAKQNLQLNPLSSDELLIAVASGDPALLNSLNAISPGNFSSAKVSHIGLETLPGQPQIYAGIDVLVLHSVDTNSLSEEQRRALSLWVQTGGYLLVSGGANGAQTATGIADLLPVELTNGFSQGSLARLDRSANSTGLPTTTTLSEVRPRQDAGELFTVLGNTELGYKHSVGQGTVAFTLFDLATTRGWGGEGELWEETLDIVQHSTLGSVARQQSFNLLADSLHSNALALLPVPGLLCLLLLYILAIGPINYLVLRRLGKLEWAWGTIPLVVVLFVGGIYLSGRLLRGSDARITQIAVVQGSANQDRGVFTTYNGLFSPDRSRYTFSFPPETLVQELESFGDFGGDSGNVIASDTATEVRNSLIDIRSVRTVLSESSGDTDIRVESALQASTTAIRGDLRYTGAAPLEDAIVVRGEAYQSLGSLAPGATTTVDLDPNGTDYPYSLNLDQIASIDRKQVLNRLADINRYSGRFLEETGVYLIGWRSTPLTAVQVNGSQPPNEGLTLYIIWLGEG